MKKILNSHLHDVMFKRAYETPRSTSHSTFRRYLFAPARAMVCAMVCVALAGVIGMAGISAAHAQTAQSETVITLTVLNPVSTTTYSISIIKNGTGSGTVTSSDGNIICGSTCFENNIPNASTTVLIAVADPGSTFFGWSVGGDPAVCPGTGTCTATTTEVITATFNLNSTPPPPPNTPPTQPIASPSGPSQFFFEDFSSETGTSSAVINWYTSLPSISSMSWGLNADGASGSGSETAYSIPHSVELDNLAPDTDYVLVIGAADQYGQVIYTTYPFRTLPISNSIPLNVTDFAGQVSFGGNILLTWVNPFEPDFDYVVITRGTRFFPRDPNEGYLVYQGPEEEVLDTSAIPGQEYYYSAFAFNTEGAHSSGTLLEYGLPFVSGAPATSTPIFGGGTPGMTSSILSLINFIQNNKLIPEINSTVTVEADLPTLVEIPASIVPKNTEETTITVAEGTAAEQTFIFEKLNDGSLEAFIPAILPTGPTPFEINFLQWGSGVRVTGTFIATGPTPPFVPQNMFSYLFQTYVSNNFLCTTLPVLFMLFELIIILIILLLVLNLKNE